MKLSATLAAVLALTAAGQAAALSCLRPDPETTFDQIAALPEPWFVLRGVLTFDPALLPENDLSNSEQSYAPVPAQFRGKGLTRQGFTADYISPVTLQVECAGPWCGSAESGLDALYFVRADPEGATVVASPCGEFVFPDPSEEVLARMVECLNAGTCGG